MNVMSNHGCAIETGAERLSAGMSDKSASIDARRGDRLHKAMIGVDRASVLLIPGMSRATMHRALHGYNLRRATWVRLACALGVNVAWLADGIGPMRPNGQHEQEFMQQEAMCLLSNEFPALAPLQRDTVRTCIILALSAFVARGQNPLPLTVAETVLRYADFVASAKGSLNERIAELVSLVEAKVTDSSAADVVSRVRLFEN